VELVANPKHFNILEGTVQSLDPNQMASQMTSFNRLYYDGLQSKLIKQQAAVDSEITKTEQEMVGCREAPKISVISNAVAKKLS